MANAEHLQILEQGVEVWNKWRKENLTVSPDLSYSDLTGADIPGIDLSGAYLPRLILAHAKLKGSSFNGSDLHAAEFTGSDLRYSDLAYTKLRDVDLIRCQLEEANLSNAELSGADLIGAVLKKADLRHTLLYGTNLLRADLTEADLGSAEIADSTFVDTNFSSTKGLETCYHYSPSLIDFRTVFQYGKLPPSFLRGCGLPESLITYLPSLLNEPIQFYSCYISYSSKDQEFAERLYADLQAKRVRVWYAPHDMPIGARIRPTIDESIRVFDKLLLVLSETSVNSQWVEQEVETALNKERESTGKTVLFPIRIDDAVMGSKAGWPMLIKNSRNIGDFHNWEEHASYTKAFERLLRDLKATVS